MAAEGDLLRRVVLAGAVALALGVVAGPADAADPTLVGDWKFDSATSGDASGHWSTFELQGGATVANGQLVVDGTGDGPNAATKWARALGYSGPTIGDKTMVSWVSLDSTAIVSGAPIGLYKPSGDQFDSVVYAERQPFRWMAGSDDFTRTTNFSPGLDDTNTGSMRQVAISYKDNGDGSQTISGCLNGVALGSYRTGKISFGPLEVPVTLFGPRGFLRGAHYGSIRAHIDESRLYSRAISCGDVADTDLDNVLAESDNCPTVANAGQEDVDGDGQGDACDDFDNRTPPPGSGTTPPGSGTNPPPTAALTLTRLELSPAAFAAAATSTPLAGHTSAARGTTIRLTINRRALLRLRFHKLTNRPPRPGRRPPRTITRTGHAGRNAIRFNGRLGGSALTPGRWRVLVTATAGGHTTPVRTARFTIVTP